MVVSNVAGRPNKRYEVLDEDGTFSDFWYRFMEQMWVRSGGSEDDLASLLAAIELVELRPKDVDIDEDNLLPPIVNDLGYDDLTPVDGGGVAGLANGGTGSSTLTANEVAQIENIDAETITNTQWAALADYATGSFTPTVTGTGTAGTFVYSTQTGSYTKIGNLVTVVLDVAVSSVSVAPTGNVRLSGLPFTSSSDLAELNVAWSGITLGATVINVMAQTTGTQLAFLDSNNDGSTFAGLPVSVLGASFQFRVTGLYYV